jgi:3-oxoacyl-[acyl-carrier protein] reductase
METNDATTLFSLEGRRALITGAAHGIGLAYARALGQAGGRIVVADIDGDGVDAAVEALQAEGIQAVGHQLDISDITSVEACRDALDAPVDVLINNAAVFATVPMSRVGYADLGVDEWDRMMEVNLRGTWLMCRTFVPAMESRGYGKVINISSGTALKGHTGRIHYVTTKGGVISFTKTLAREVGGDNVMVNCVAPGSTLSAEQRTEEDVERREAALGGRALKRVQKPGDLVGAAIFLASAASDFITGQTLVVDGGSAMH